MGVFVNHPPEEVTAILRDCGLDLAQLSGDEPPEDLQRIGPAAFKAIRLGSETALEDAIQAITCSARAAPAFLLDASVPGQYGGTGQIGRLGQARPGGRILSAAPGRRPDSGKRGPGDVPRCSPGAWTWPPASKALPDARIRRRWRRSCAAAKTRPLTENRGNALT